MSSANIPKVVPPVQRTAEGPRRTRNAIAWTSLAFAVLQSVCTFFAAMNGLRVGIGITSLVLASSTAAAIDHFHSSWLRLPMIVLAVLGSQHDAAISGDFERQLVAFPKVGLFDNRLRNSDRKAITPLR